jgi:hypothetical protein
MPFVWGGVAPNGFDGAPNMFVEGFREGSGVEVPAGGLDGLQKTFVIGGG